MKDWDKLSHDDKMEFIKFMGSELEKMAKKKTGGIAWKEN